MLGTRIIRIKMQAFVSWLSWRLSSQRQKIWAEWVSQPKWRVLLEAERQRVGDLELTDSDLTNLQDLLNTKGWSLLVRLQDHLTADASEWLYRATTANEWREAKGFLDGHLRTRQLLEVMVNLSHDGDEKWVLQQLKELERQGAGQVLAAARAGLTPAEQRQARARLERVLEAVQVQKERERGPRRSTEAS